MSSQSNSKKRTRDVFENENDNDMDELLLEFEASTRVGQEQMAIVPYQGPGGRERKRVCLGIAPPRSVSIEEKHKTNAQIKEEWKRRKQLQTASVVSPFGLPLILDKPSYTAQEVKAIIEEREKALYQGYMILQDELKALRNAKARCGWIREGEVG